MSDSEEFELTALANDAEADMPTDAELADAIRRAAGKLTEEAANLLAELQLLAEDDSMVQESLTEARETARGLWLHLDTLMANWENP